MRIETTEGRRADVALELLSEGEPVSFRNLVLQLTRSRVLTCTVLSDVGPSQVDAVVAAEEFRSGRAALDVLLAAPLFAARLSPLPRQWELCHDDGGTAVSLCRLEGDAIVWPAQYPPAPDSGTADPRALSFAGFELWVYGWAPGAVPGRPYEDWLRVSARCVSNGADVRVSGPIMSAAAVVRWVQECERLYETLSGEAVLDSGEPALKLRLTAIGSGGIAARVEMAPVPGLQEHFFTFEIDQTYLPTVIAQGRALIHR